MFLLGCVLNGVRDAQVQTKRLCPLPHWHALILKLEFALALIPTPDPDPRHQILFGSISITITTMIQTQTASQTHTISTDVSACSPALCGSVGWRSNMGPSLTMPGRMHSRYSQTRWVSVRKWEKWEMISKMSDLTYSETQVLLFSHVYRVAYKH